MAKHYDESSVLRDLTKRKVGQFDYANKVVVVTIGNPNVGNKTFGKLDYLQHYCGWRVIYRKQAQVLQTRITIANNGDNDTSEKGKKKLSKFKK